MKFTLNEAHYLRIRYWLAVNDFEKESSVTKDSRDEAFRLDLNEKFLDPAQNLNGSKKSPLWNFIRDLKSFNENKL